MFIRKSTIQLLRFHYSLFLLPVYLFALSQLNEINWSKAFLVFFILHVLLYPSSNGYNSYMDKDNSPIGGLLKPLRPTRQLFYTTIIMDLSAITISFFIDRIFVTGVAFYIIASRAYSFRGIRLKKFPVIGYLTVIICQGAVIFFLAWHGSNEFHNIQVPVLPMLAATCLIGGYYPLTQIYQHQDDLNDGVKTISYALGIKGTFIFCGILFSIATFLIYLTFKNQQSLISFLIFVGFMSPVLIFYSGWMRTAWIDKSKADFLNSLRMNIISSACTSGCFIVLIILK